MNKILLTSFSTWLPHHKSNASDDLLAIVQQQGFNEAELIFLRQLPVNIPQATQKAIATLQTQQPHAVICCGMAESYTHLTLESNATCGEKQHYTPINLEHLTTQLSHTKISHNAGKFVCEGLYYEVLNYLYQTPSPPPCVFVHVPRLTHQNTPRILKDFLLLLKFLAL